LTPSPPVVCVFEDVPQIKRAFKLHCAERVKKYLTRKRNCGVYCKYSDKVSTLYIKSDRGYTSKSPSNSLRFQFVEWEVSCQCIQLSCKRDRARITKGFGSCKKNEQPMRIVADTGPIIALSKIGKISLLKSFAGEVLIPPMVYKELFGKIGSESNRQGVS
jgi:hypothetical protein